MQWLKSIDKQGTLIYWFQVIAKVFHDFEIKIF